MPVRQILAAVLFLSCVIFAGFVLRATDAQSVFTADGVVLQEFDPLYHMRRVFMTLAGYPHVPYSDPYLNYPEGSVVIWPPLFDLFVAAVNKLAGYGAQDTGKVEALSAYIVPVIGAVTCVPVFFIALEIAGAPAAALAAVFLALIPAHIFYSRIGFVDHHVAVTLIECLMLLCVLKALDSGNTRKWWWTFLAALSMAAGFGVWNGYIFHAAILDLYLFTLLIMDWKGAGLKVAPVIWGTHLPAAAAMLPVVMETISHGGRPFSSVTTSFFHIGILCCIGLGAAVLNWGAAAGLKMTSWKAKIGVGAALAAGVWAALDFMTEAVVEGMGWVLTTDKFMSSVMESRPVIAGFEAWHFSEAVMSLSGFFLIIPVMLAAMFRKWRKQGAVDAKQLLLVVWTGALFLMTLKQRRFAETLAPAMAILAGWFIVEIRAALAGHIAGKSLAGARWSGAISFMAAALICVAAFEPYYAQYAADPQKLLAVFGAMDKSAGKSYDVKVFEAVQDFRKAAGLGNPTHRAISPAPAVMNHWGIGHKILYLADMPVVACNFGSHAGEDSYRDWAEFYIETDEAKAVKILERRGVRYVVADYMLGIVDSAAIYTGQSPSQFHRAVTIPGASEPVSQLFLPKMIETIFFRLAKLAGSETSLSNAKGEKFIVPALDRFRMMVDSEKDDDMAQWKFYEFVNGARLAVHGGKPGERLEISYSFKSSAGRERVYRKNVAAGPDGVFHATLPYSSEKPEYGQVSKYRLLAQDGLKDELFVRERDVIAGEEITHSLRKK
ncbi:MAG: hypothetical protein HZB29_13770 [Nitrospinae bacterium]|nr:hypothetical protein [Nitrospinota bacterium]